MFAPSRYLVRETLAFEKISRCACPRPAVRYFSSSPSIWSGHSKWSKIKHDKAAADGVKNKQRSAMAKEIENAVKLGGPDPNMNPRLTLAISTAKKVSMPKANIEAAIARGQGLSSTGAALESVTLEAILPPSVATVVDCQTDNKLRALAELRTLVRDCGGNVTPIGYLFGKKGRIIFRKKEGLGVDEAFDPALNAGALDVDEDDEGRIILYTEPEQTKSASETLAKELELEIQQTEIIYDPNEDTKIGLDDEEAVKCLIRFLDALQDFPGIQGVYFNWKKGTIPEELWTELQSKAEL